MCRRSGTVGESLFLPSELTGCRRPVFSQASEVSNDELARNVWIFYRR